MVHIGNKKRINNYGRWCMYSVIGVVGLATLWFYLDRPISTNVLNAVVTQGVWKVQRHSGATYQGVAKVEDGTFINFTTYQSVPVGARIKLYRYRRPMSGLTTYEYAGP